MTKRHSTTGAALAAAALMVTTPLGAAGGAMSATAFDWVLAAVALALAAGLAALWISSRRQRQEMMDRLHGSTARLDDLIAQLEERVQDMGDALQRKQEEEQAATRVAPASPAPFDGTLRGFVEEGRRFLDKDLSRRGVAQEMGVSQAEISRMLDGIEPGLSFPDYIRNLRIDYALGLIKDGPALTVGEIAEKSGFYNIRTFQRSFLAVVGQPPREYIKSVRGQDAGPDDPSPFGYEPDGEDGEESGPGE